MNPTRQKLFDEFKSNAEAVAMAKSDYQNNKRGWVTFKGGKKKVKLRKYLETLVTDIVKVCDEPRTEIRELLIKYYNKDGVKGMHRAAQILLIQEK